MIKIQNLIRRFIFSALVYLAFGQIGNAQQVKIADFEAQLKATQNPQLLDVRTASEFGGGHLPSAKNINVKEPDFEQKIQILDKNQPVFVYCLSGGRSKIAHELLAKNGFTNIVEMEGGYLKWSSENKPVEGVAKSTIMDGKITKDELLKNIAENKLVLLDFYATWCGPCKLMDPKIKRLVEKYGDKVKVIKVDTDRNKTVAIQQLVSELPTFIFYKNGKEFWRGVGEQDEEWLEDLFVLNIGK
jgi:thioredoxin 1